MRTLCALTLLAFLLTACGFKGPLYLPEAKPAQASAPAAQN
jgi:predicted small lipoprotein YifL